MDHPRFSIIALTLFAIVSGLYIYAKLSPKEIPLPVILQLPFGGTVPKEITHGDINKKQIIFTFDAGEGSQSALRILEILRRHNIKGTFFITGKWVLHNPGLVQNIVSEGHEIFNHSFDHPYLTSLSDQQIRTELIDMDNTIVDLIKQNTKPYFRPPYGDRDLRVLKIAARAGFQSVYWTIDARDWMENEGVTADQVRERILSNLSPGTIILMHVGDNITGEILDDVFTTIENKGYKIVSLTQGI